MVPGNTSLRFFRKALQNLKTNTIIIVWTMLILGMLMIPVLFVFASPFLIASKSTSFMVGFMPKKIPLQERPAEGTTLFPPAHKLTIVRGESEPSPVQPRQPSSYDRRGFENTLGEIHLLMDTSQHRLFVMQGEQILYVAIASTGKGSMLVDPENPEKMWTFETPKGTFRILNKLEKPVWIRPDWAFIEQGDPIPEKMDDRLMPGVLGPYALGFGDGYFIHGALYSNLLGQDVTHGCIQLHPADLQFVFETVPLGAPLIIT